MDTITVRLPDKQYPIWIEDGLLADAGQRIRSLGNWRKAAVVTDANVDALYGQALIEGLQQQGIATCRIVLPPGEQSKSLDRLESIYNPFIDFRLTRADVIIALGGGVVGDIAGFAAATFLRGVAYIQVPTTLLAQIDSSIGGKVAVNLPRGKNLVGAFYQPEAVLIDPTVLRTLPDRVLRDGIAEVIKTAALASEKLFTDLVRYQNAAGLVASIGPVIAACCRIKQRVVEQDEKDTGLRMILNFGHTIGHAIEQYFRYETYTHGEAVAIGMARITEKSEEFGYTASGTAAKLVDLISRYGLPVAATEWDRIALLKTVAVDKKNIGSSLNIIVLDQIGKARIEKIRPDEFERFL